MKPGDLLVQIDTRDVQNQYNQAEADLKASQAKLQVSEQQKKRSDELFKARVITAQEFESRVARLRELQGSRDPLGSESRSRQSSGSRTRPSPHQPRARSSRRRYRSVR